MRSLSLSLHALVSLAPGFSNVNTKYIKVRLVHGEYRRTCVHVGVTLVFLRLASAAHRVHYEIVHATRILSFFVGAWTRARAALHNGASKRSGAGNRVCCICIHAREGWKKCGTKLGEEGEVARFINFLSSLRINFFRRWLFFHVRPLTNVGKCLVIIILNPENFYFQLCTIAASKCIKLCIIGFYNN